MKFQVYACALSHPWYSALCIIQYIILELMEFSESYLQISFKKEKLQEPRYSHMSGTNWYGIQTAF